ncbi:SCO4225 family membrane protein [Streptomyces sp. NPDC057136]|uniref:SCO4225 family membrane protein n=1 Tax=Streptomyces sp. NPDC057136 TaxID=3346029 RepID=UPI0036426D2F
MLLGVSAAPSIPVPELVADETGLVGASVAMATAVTLFSSDPGFIWVWPAFLTAPASLLAAAVGGAVWDSEDGPAWALVGTLIVCALIQSLVLGTLLEALRNSRRRRRTRPHHS